MKKLDLIGQKYNRLTAIGFNNETKLWLCKCDCGNETELTTNRFKNGGIKSCGCLNIESRMDKVKKMNEAVRKYEPRIASAISTWKKRYSDGISFEDFLFISQMNCFYCKRPPSNTSNSHKSDKKAAKETIANGNFIYNGLDRLDSTKNHDINNVVPCCWRCNAAKSNKTLEEFMLWAKGVYKWQQ